MKKKVKSDLISVAILLVAAMMLIGCGTSGGAGVTWGGGQKDAYEEPHHGKKGPPPWAPAHGYRAKHRYLYYPGCPVYYDTTRSLYFYLEGDNWVVAVSLPQHLKVHLGDHVVIEMDTDRPYTYYSEHKKAYPANKVKKNKSKKWANK